MRQSQFMEIAASVVGQDWGWQKKLSKIASDLGQNLGQTTISQIKNNPEKEITGDARLAILAIWEAANERRIPVVVDTPTVDDDVSTIDEIKVMVDPDSEKTDEQITSEISEKFQVFEECIEAVVCGSRHATLVSGPAGCGKSFMVDRFRSQATGYFFQATGGISNIGLYKRLYATKDNGVLVFDDCDEVFWDETRLNLLKGALDTKPIRTISWLKESRYLVDDEGETIPNTFNFQGRVLFLTNIDFDREIARGNKMAPHLAALRSRCGYLDLGLHSRRRMMLRLIQVIESSEILSMNGITDPFQQTELIEFLRENHERFRELSLRLIVKIAEYMRDVPDRWQVHAQALEMKKAA